MKCKQNELFEKKKTVKNNVAKVGEKEDGKHKKTDNETTRTMRRT